MEYERGAVRISARFDDGSNQNYFVSDFALQEQRAWRSWTEFADDVCAHAHRVWSEEYENHLMRTESSRVARAVSEVYAQLGPCEMAEDFRMLSNRYLDHVRRYHGARVMRPASVVAISTDPADQREMTATEIRRRQAEVDNSLSERMRQAFDRMQQTLFMGSEQHWAEIGISLWDFDEVGSKTANEKGIILLKENLTPAQRAEYEQHRYFHVKGGMSGKTYRIKHGRQMNVVELNWRGKPKCGWCFLPGGGLCAGDVMLAQKTALEVAENEALRVANRFAV